MGYRAARMHNAAITEWFSKQKIGSMKYKRDNGFRNMEQTRNVTMLSFPLGLTAMLSGLA